jgi:hypothetical protein
MYQTKTFRWISAIKGTSVVVIARYLDLQLPVKSVSFTTEVVSSNTAYGEVYSIQQYVIQFVSDFLPTFQGFSPGTPVFSTYKTDRHDITEILLKMALNTITLTL